jgi:hypothetical protein
MALQGTRRRRKEAEGECAWRSRETSWENIVKKNSREKGRGTNAL